MTTPALPPPTGIAPGESRGEGCLTLPLELTTSGKRRRAWKSRPTAAGEERLRGRPLLPRGAFEEGDDAE